MKEPEKKNINMNLQENIRRILNEIEEDKIQIRLGRSAERHFGKVQNIIIMVDDQDITSEDDVPGLGKMNIVIKDNEIIVGDIFIPEKYRKQGIATIVYQKISDYFNLPIVNSKTKGFNQTIEGGHIWKKRERFEPKNLQEQIRKVLREELLNETKFFLRRINDLDEIKNLLSINADQTYNETKSYDQFKYELTLRVVESIIWNRYGIGWEDLPEQEEIDYVTQVSNTFDKRIKQLYKEVQTYYNKRRIQ
jgi:hypothetical protein